MKLYPRTGLRIVPFALAAVLAFGAVFAFGAAAAHGQITVTLAPSRDNTLYEDPGGAFSNGAGEFLFAGRTGTLAAEVLRRAVLAFDLDAIPPGSTIVSAELSLTMSRTVSGPRTVDLHRLLSDWGEGKSDADQEEGGGALAMDGDATWIHTFSPTEFWTTPGGDLAPVPSASQSVDGIGIYIWGSTAQMVADVQGWLDDPSSNHGWLVRGDEVVTRSAKRFNSRENLDDESIPQLAIQFLPTIFDDGFESGSTTAWDDAIGLPR